MHIVFVHVPVPTVIVPERKAFWKAFDLRYHAMHQNLLHMNHPLFEIPHWVTWLGGVLAAEGFESLQALDVYAIKSELNGIDVEQTTRAILDCPGDVFLFSPMTPNLHCALEVASCVKATFPKSTTIFGGVVATPLCEWVARQCCVDYVVRGRAEYALPLLLRAIENGERPTTVGNLTYCIGDEVVSSDSCYPQMRVEDIAFPKIDLFPAKIGDDVRYLRQVYGLGCPYSCPFCTIQTIGQRSTYFPIDRVVAEIRGYRSHFGDYHHVYFGDETFTLSTARTLAICDRFSAEGNVTYDCQTRLDYLSDPRLPAALASSGCRWLEIGLEVLNQEGQDAFKQRTNLKNLKDRLRIFRDVGIAVCSFLINGLPNQTLDDMKRSIESVCGLLDQGLLHATYLFGLVPYPGSRMYNNPGHYGMSIRHKNWALYQEDLEPVFITSHAKPEEMHRALLEGVRDLAIAMAPKPYLGADVVLSEDSAHGSIWSGTHV